MDKYCLYAHINPTNNKVYFGITKELKIRWYGKGSRYYTSKGIYAAFKKYGWNHFDHIVLYDNLTKEQACEQECLWIAAFKSIGKSYNLAAGGEGLSGFNRGDEWKAKISKANKGRTYSPEIKEKLSKAHAGISVPSRRKKVYMFNMYTKQLLKEYSWIEEAANELGVRSQNIRAALTGISITAAGYIWRYSPTLEEATIRNSAIGRRYLKILCFDTNHDFIKAYKSAQEAGKDLGCNSHCILNCLNGGSGKYKGFIWEREIKQ